ncbi:ATP-grasp domain-containing protein [Streptomyces zaomyceticus]|uniref:ATP-grasp domain-containing protein n=2 Tax=Streptomyces zaomyceticus TaxID=68286 RepID=A0ABZ1LB60_9ACTN|nr:ATP-grasp domain-containing protein [Streptomyces zaomyceticus]
MNYLILNRSALAIRPYREWMGDGHRLLLITDARALSADDEIRGGQLASFDATVPLVDYHDSVLVEREALRLHAEFGFDEIIALSEFDLLRAARLRDLLGLRGQNEESAIAFRDKLVMKDLLREAGVPLAPYAPAADATSLIRFTQEHGFPIVVKPRRGGGSMGIEILHDEDELWNYATRTTQLGTDDGAPLLVEAHVEHELFHIDGLVVDGHIQLIWPSTQGTTTCLGMLDGHMLHSTMLDADDPRLDDLRKLTTTALETLPTPTTTIFHAEIFGTPDGLVFNEIASRMAGGRIEEQIRLGFGLHLPKLYIRALAGHELPRIPSEPARIGGLALFPPRPGLLRAVPGECRVPGISSFTVSVAAGTRLGTAHASVDNFASALAVGSTRAEVEQAISRLRTWVEAETVIEPETEPQTATGGTTA